jgi:hypothetical protein
MLRRIGVFLGFSLLAASALLAQTSGTILGNVHDTSGAEIGGATITITNLDRGTSQTATSNQAGDYLVPFLPPGSYQLSVEKDGFQKEQAAPTLLDVDQRAQINFTLKPGAVSETVQVSSTAPLINSDSAALGQVIEKQQVQNLPLNGRNFAQLVYLAPGVTEGQQGENLAGNSTYNPRDSSAFNALGAQESTSAWLVDGIMDNEFTFNTVMVQPSVESIQEFKLLTGVYSAEYGRGSGVVTTQTRSGTNQWHGSAMDFYRTSDLDARTYFNDVGSVKPAYIRNQWEATVGGPIWKNKSFFFLDYFGYTLIQGNTFVNTVPTALDRTGNFSDQSFTIYNPYSTTVNSAGQTVRTPFPGNIVPAQYLNPIGMTIANLLPLPNQPNSPLVNNYIDSIPNNTLDNGGNVRIDHKFSDKDSIFGRYSYERFTLFDAKGQSACCIQATAAQQQEYDLGPLLVGGQNTVLLASGLSINETHVFSPQLINQFIIGYAHTNPLTRQSDYGLNGSNALGIEGINISSATTGIPSFYIGGAGGGLSYAGPNDGPDFLPANPRDTSYQLSDDISWTKGAHQFSFGYRLLRILDSPYANSETRGVMYFEQNLTNDPVTAGGGSGLASLEMGLMANGTSAAASRGYYQSIPYLTIYEDALYAQDDWKVSPRLTLNLGLRWDLFNPYTAKGNGLTNFDPSTLSLIYAGVNGSSSADVQTQRRDFGPRIGFSYDLTGKGDTVIRGGYAISYTPQQPSGSEMLPENVPQTISQNTPTTATYPICTAPCSNTPAGLQGQTVINQPFPTPVAQQPMTTAQLIADNPSVIGMAFTNETPSFANWSLNIQKQFAKDYMAEIAYVGSRSVHLMNYENLQEIQPGPTSEPVVDRITIPSLYPMLTVDQAQNRNYANFNGLTGKITKRLTHGLNLISAYTWSKVLDDAGSQANGGGYVGSPQTITNLTAGYGPSGYNIPQRFVQSWVWLLPAGPGRQFLNNKGVAAYILGGWEFDGIGTIQSGFPFTVDNMSSCPNNAGNCWPDQISNPRGGQGFHQTYANWYNAAAFAVPCQGALGPNNSCSNPAYRYGDVGRGTLRGPQTTNFDLSMAKTFPIGERVSVMFRLDAFDAFNRPVLGVPNQSLNPSAPAASSSAITTTEGDNRDLQGSLKLTF